MTLHSPSELRELVERYLDELALAAELGTLQEVLRYPLRAGGKRIRPVLCLATTEAAGGDIDQGLAAAASVELVHTFSLVHDDLPALDDDAVRRGRPSTHIEFGEAAGLLAGDALLAEAFRLATAYPTTAVVRELSNAALAMIGGQYRDVTGDGDLEALHRLKTGALFAASVGCGLWAAAVPEEDQRLWRAFGAEVGLAFQIVDDVLDGDGYVLEHGTEGARALADAAGNRAMSRLGDIRADTSVLTEIVAGLAARIS